MKVSGAAPLNCVCVRCKEERSNSDYTNAQRKNLVVNRTCVICQRSVRTKPVLSFPWSKVKAEVFLCGVPREVLSEIVGLLDICDHFVFLKVCKYWNNWMTEYLYTRTHYDSLILRAEDRIEFLLGVLKKVAHIDSIYYGYSELSPLRQEHFVDISNLTFFGLVELDLSSTNITNLDPIQKLCTNLKKLYCSKCNLLSNISSLVSCTKYNKIECIDFSWDRLIPRQQFEVLSKLTSLKILNIGYTSFGDHQLASLTNLTKLESIILNGNNYSFSVVGNTLKHFPLLDALSLDSSRFPEDSSQQQMILPSSILYLSLDFCQWVDDTTIELVAAKLTKLQDLSLLDCYFTNQGCQSLSKMTQLKLLNMYCYESRFTKDAVHKLALDLPNCSIRSDFMD
eukprot:TRINITY_DN18080_c0_g1_i1.p1 TRINITY_DN18080_c0_g1~~TRINITY_DN18080_c0_g1_i1.p1  ORF type:complete len:396 (+),score=83.41 TRINITY_DN18080_c0_g1_i1:13-1200(+)